jgi:hypothetical protein
MHGAGEEIICVYNIQKAETGPAVSQRSKISARPSLAQLLKKFNLGKICNV